jgi:hypothetical protein
MAGWGLFSCESKLQGTDAGKQLEAGSHPQEGLLS